MQALKPTSFLSDFQDIGRVESGDQLTDEEDALASVARSNGWEVLKAYIEGINKQLDEMVLHSMAAGMDYEEIGRKTAVKEVAKDVLKRVIERVEDAREAADRRAN